MRYSIELIHFSMACVAIVNMILAEASRKSAVGKCLCVDDRVMEIAPINSEKHAYM